MLKIFRKCKADIKGSKDLPHLRISSHTGSTDLTQEKTKTNLASNIMMTITNNAPFL